MKAAEAILSARRDWGQGERRSKISLKKFGVSAPLRFCGLYVKKRPLSQKVSFFTTEAQRSGNAEFFNAFALGLGCLYLDRSRS